MAVDVQKTVAITVLEANSLQAEESRWTHIIILQNMFQSQLKILGGK